MPQVVDNNTYRHSCRKHCIHHIYLTMRVSLVFTLVSLTTPATAFVQHQSVVQPLTSFSSTNHHVKSPFQKFVVTPYINNNNVVKFSSTARKDSEVPGLIMDGSKYCCVVVISCCSDYKFCMYLSMFVL